jgi:hypothetical protein
MKYTAFALLSIASLVTPCVAEKDDSSVHRNLEKQAHFLIPVKKEIYHEMLTALPPVKISPNREKLVEKIVSEIDKNALEIGKERRSVIANEILEKTVLPLLKPRVEQFNSIMVSAASKDNVSAGFLAFKGLAAGMAEHEDASGIIVYGNYSQSGNSEAGWKWSANSIGASSSKRYVSAAIDETLTIDLKTYGSNHSFELLIACTGKVMLHKKYKRDYHFTEKPFGQIKTSIELTPQLTITASKTIEGNYSQYFSVEGESSPEVSKDIDSEAKLVFDFDATEK